MVGANQIFAGPNPQPRDICEIVQHEKVTFTGAVPTVWIAVKELCEREGWDISSLRTIAIGGSAAPMSLQHAYEKQFGVFMSHAWGMTEMTPLGTVCRLKSYMADWPEERRWAVRSRVGYASVGVDARVVGGGGGAPQRGGGARPLPCVAPRPGGALDPAEIVEFLRPQLARWALPDDVVLIEAVPKTSVGKFDKKVLRERFKGWQPRE